MNESRDVDSTKGWLSRSERRVIAAVTVFLIIGAMIAPWSHDEDQYFAATQLLGRGPPMALPYIDYLYFQTPLFPLWGKAVTALAPGWGLIAARLGQALLGLATFGALWFAGLRIGLLRHRAMLASLGMVCCHPFLFSASVFRNDMLPALLEVLALAAMLPAARNPGAMRWSAPFLAGLAICLAASTKITFGLLGIAPLAWLLTVPGVTPRRRWKLIGALAAGGLVGLAPTLTFFGAAPAKMWWQVVDFSAQAPLDWFMQTGRPSKIAPFGRLRDGIGILLMGPIGVALVLSVRDAWRRWGTPWPDCHLLVLLDLFILVSLIASIIPAPSWRQYFIILLPPLFLRLPFALQQLHDSPLKRAQKALGLFVLVGVGVYAVYLSKTITKDGYVFLTRWQESHWIGREMVRAGAAGPIATLNPGLAFDSGFLPDRRLAAGVFAWRWTQAGEAVARNAGITHDAFAAQFAVDPPGAIVTGYEAGEGTRAEPDNETPLRRWVAIHRWRAISSPFGQARLYLPPASPLPTASPFAIAKTKDSE